MHEIILKTTIDECIVSAWKYNVGEVNVRSLLVELCTEMLNCDMSFVTFTLDDGTVYESLVKDGKAEIPPFYEPQFIEVGAYSADIEGDVCIKRYSPRPVNVYVNNGSYSGNGTEPPIPTAGDFERLLAELDNKLGADSVVHEFKKNATFEENEVYSANTINAEFNKQGLWFEGKFAKIDEGKENVSNKSTHIDYKSTHEEYASAQSVYEFGELIIASHRIEVDEQIEDLRTEFNELIGGIENGSY